MKQLDVKLMHPKVQITKVISRIYKNGMTTTSGGNISIKDENGDIWVTPSAIDKGTLTEKDIICVKKDGTIIGDHTPSSEFPFHKAIYDVRPEIKAVIHAHPPALVSFSIVRNIPNTNIIPQAKEICGSIGYAPYGMPGSEELGAKIAAQFKDSNNMAVIMENHGTVLGGSDMMDAYTRFETLEFCARTIINAKTIGEPVYLTDEQIKSFEVQIPYDIPKNKVVSYPPEERSIRQDICNIVRRACDQGLMISSYGTVSVRWKDNDFLITPPNVARWDIMPDDIVQIKDGKAEPEKTPSRSFSLHQKIYEMNPHINSIILTQPPHLMAYGTTGVKFDVRTIPESWIFLQDVPCLPFGTHFEGDNTIPELLSESVPSVLISNDSFLVTGDKLLQTFDRLEVAEFSAKSLVMGAPLGTLFPINDAQVEALRKKFLG
ncbi:class II aldolase/adducin family protein [Saccharicrinis fermentans]|uniref:L-fuculose phosphate aldolase n=1 Tax=Saccharicrinis fermentans DSM 9555 = JCM 21142 TaxID=869213 RepID=W7YCD0_9BACT|nr:class II aldolase/adducin family protein [Saccharicrinis fermentans]GAF02096.1 L-fuculose phosphate aldolase [Saccharicrinis fermentans DSM 9555 = JCM 21142]